MIRLIQNEVTKVFKKKSIYIALAIILICIIFINCMNKYANGHSYDDDLLKRIANMEQELKNYNPQNPSDISSYISLKTYLDEMKLMQKYGSNSWQATVIQDKMHAMIEQMNTAEYGIEKSQANDQIIKEKYDNYIKKLDTNDWKYFVQSEIEEINQQMKTNEAQKKATVDKVQIKTIEQTQKQLELNKQILQWRLDKDISYAPSDKNIALKNYQRYQSGVIAYEEAPSDEYEEKIDYQTNLSKANTLRYMIENDITTKANDCRSSILNFFDQYGILITAVIIMIAGTIVSDEFNKGTIKLLLVKPYKRWKILLAKFITCIITMLIITGLVLIMQLLVSGILFGFDSLSIPEIHYNFNTNQIETMNVFSYLALIGINQLPMFVLTITIAFMLSCVFTNSALAIVISLLGFMSTEMINMMALQLKLGFMKFFITPNWNLSPYLFGGLSDFEGLTFEFSVVINILYLVVMLAISFFAFEKKNIKNI